MLNRLSFSDISNPDVVVKVMPAVRFVPDTVKICAGEAIPEQVLKPVKLPVTVIVGTDSGWFSGFRLLLYKSDDTGSFRFTFSGKEWLESWSVLAIAVRETPTHKIKEIDSVAENFIEAVLIIELERLI